MRSCRRIRLPAGSVARTMRAPGALRALRALLFGALMTCLLGGDCHWAFSSNTSGDDHHDDGGTTVIVTNLTTGDDGGAVDPAATLSGVQLDPALFELGECLVELTTGRVEVGPGAVVGADSVGVAEAGDSADASAGAGAAQGRGAAVDAGGAADRVPGGESQPVLLRVTALPPARGLAGVSPARLWPPERIGEAELAVFAAGLLVVNEDLLYLPVPATGLLYLATTVSDGDAIVRFGDRAAGGAPVIEARFGPTGDLVSIETLGDRTPDLR